MAGMNCACTSRASGSGFADMGSHPPARPKHCPSTLLLLLGVSTTPAAASIHILLGQVVPSAPDRI